MPDPRLEKAAHLVAKALTLLRDSSGTLHAATHHLSGADALHAMGVLHALEIAEQRIELLDEKLRKQIEEAA